MSREILITPQPRPVPGEGSVLVKPFLVDYVGDSIMRDKVRKDVETRLDDGEKRYGQPLMTNNGREAWIDYYQELLDAIAFGIQLELQASSSTLQNKIKMSNRTLFSLAVSARERMEALEILDE